MAISASNVYADGCYICRNKDAYVKFVGDDTNDKRKKAEQCGCEVGGTRSECYAANLTVLCTVSLNEKSNKNEVLACAVKPAMSKIK